MDGQGAAELIRHGGLVGDCGLGRRRDTGTDDKFVLSDSVLLSQYL